MNIKEAIRLFESNDYSQIDFIIEKANQGNILAQRRVGLAYQLGLGVDIDSHKAISYFKQALDGGSGEAAHNLATLYAVNLGEVDKAKKFYSIAASMGFKVGTE